MEKINAPLWYLLLQISYNRKLNGTGKRKSEKYSTKYKVLPSGIKNCRKPHCTSVHTATNNEKSPRFKKISIFASVLSLLFLRTAPKKRSRQIIAANSIPQLIIKVTRLSVKIFRMQSPHVPYTRLTSFP